MTSDTHSSPPAPSSNRPRRRILVADDDPAIITLLDRALGQAHDVVVATDGRAALERASRAPFPDLVILDVMMPQIDGFEVAQRLRMQPEGARIPIIFLTARDSGLDALKGQGLGARFYVTKPFRVADLMEKVKLALPSG